VDLPGWDPAYQRYEREDMQKERGLAVPALSQPMARPEVMVVSAHAGDTPAQSHAVEQDGKTGGAVAHTDDIPNQAGGLGSGGRNGNDGGFTAGGAEFPGEGGEDRKRHKVSDEAGNIKPKTGLLERAYLRVAYPLVRREPMHQGQQFITSVWLDGVDPQSKLHEYKEGDLLQAETAAAPQVYFSKLAQPHRDTLTVDLQLIQDELARSQFDPYFTNSFAVVIHDKQDEALQELGPHTGGWYNESSLLVDTGNKLTVHPLVLHLVGNYPERHLNQLTWHEAGHAKMRVVNGIPIREQLYRNPKNERRTVFAGAATSVAGTLSEFAGVEDMTHHTTGMTALDIGLLAGGSLLFVGGVLVATSPREFLHRIGRGEVYADAYAARRKRLKPIKKEDY
jgi:hypothetical protein